VPPPFTEHRIGSWSWLWRFAVADTGAVEEHHVIEQGAVAFFDCLQFGDEVVEMFAWNS